MDPVEGFLAVSGICGRLWIMDKIIFEAGKKGYDTIILLGNTCSLEIIENIIEAGMNPLGVKGNLDDYSIVKAFKKHGGFIEGKYAFVNGIRIAALGEQVLNDYEKIKKDVEDSGGRVDVLLSFYPPVRLHNWCGKTNCPGSIYIDELYRELEPKHVVIGRSIACQGTIGNLHFAGDASRGEFLVVRRKEGKIDVERYSINVYSKG